MDLTPPNLKALNVNVHSLYDAGFTAVETQWQKVAMHVPSNSSGNVYHWMGSLKGFRKWVGDRVYNRIKAHSFSIENEKFEDTFTLPRDVVEDDQFGTYAPMATELGRMAAAFPDELVFDEVLVKAFTTLCYDGQYLVDTDHPVLDANGVEQSVSNSGGGSGAPWFIIDDTRMVKPIIFQERKKMKLTTLDADTDPNIFKSDELVWGVDGRMNVGAGLWQLIQGSKQDLTAANYAARRAAMLSLTGDYGRKLRVKPSLLVVGPSNESAAREILEADRNAAGATNIHRNTAKLLIVPELG